MYWIVHEFVVGWMSMKAEKKHIFIRYHQALLSLVTELLSRIQLQSGKHRLGDLDDTTLDDDDETEWKQFLRISIETVMKAAELIPDDVLRILVRFLLFSWNG